MFILDSSGSVRSNNFDKMKALVADVVKKFPVSDQNERVSIESHIPIINAVYSWKRPKIKNLDLVISI